MHVLLIKNASKISDKSSRLHFVRRNRMLQCTDIRLWYIGSYTIMAKPIKSLELHYPMIQFLIKRLSPDRVLSVSPRASTLKTRLRLVGHEIKTFRANYRTYHYCFFGLWYKSVCGRCFRSAQFLARRAVVLGFFGFRMSEEALLLPQVWFYVFFRHRSVSLNQYLLPRLVKGWLDVHKLWGLRSYNSLQYQK